jgi:hypothetical protein
LIAGKYSVEKNLLIRKSVEIEIVKEIVMNKNMKNEIVNLSSRNVLPMK